MATMKALQITSSGSKPSLSLATIPKPSVKPGYVLVRVIATSINPSDVINSRGGFPHTTFPRVPGRDFAGVVEDGPAQLLGQEIYGTSGGHFSFTEDGAHAQYCLAKQEGIARKPDNLNFVQAAVVGVPFTTAAIALRRALAKSSDSILVIGANGSVGSAVVQLAKAKGCRVMRAMRGSAGDVNLTDDPEMAQARVLTDGRGPDVVIDTVGTIETMKRSLGVLGKGGRFSFISAPKAGSTELNIDMKSVYRNEIGIVGSNSLEHGLEELAQEMNDMADLFEAGHLTPPTADQLNVIAIEQGVEAYSNSSKKHVISFESKRE